MNTSYKSTTSVPGGPIAIEPIHHTAKLKGMLQEVIGHLRSDVLKVQEPKAQAHFETSAEVLNGLLKAFEHYEKKEEEAWR